MKPELPKIADEKGIIFVCPDGKNSWYWDSPKNQAYRYETFVASELVKYTDKNYATIPEKKGRAITGLSMGGHGAFKVPLIDGFKNHPNYLLHKLVLYGWYTKRAFLAVLLWYIHPFSRMRLVGFIPKCFDETFNSSNAHLVDSLTICAWSLLPSFLL